MLGSGACQASFRLIYVEDNALTPPVGSGIIARPPGEGEAASPAGFANTVFQ
jgi:hypothetical protein